MPVRAGSHRVQGTGAWRRGTLEFDRVAFFSDAVYAIAMTLLIVGVSQPVLKVGQTADSHALWTALGHQSDQFISFAIAFVVIGRYWVGHHSLFSLLDHVNRLFVSMNMLYLGCIAFLPFPTALIGRYEQNPVAFVVYVSMLAAASGFEVMLYVTAFRSSLLAHPPTPITLRWTVLAQCTPLFVFAISVPIAFLASDTWALLSFLLMAPVAQVIRRLSHGHLDASADASGEEAADDGLGEHVDEASLNPPPA
jgi:uncharacterized membrane protein